MTCWSFGAARRKLWTVRGEPLVGMSQLIDYTNRPIGVCLVRSAAWQLSVDARRGSRNLAASLSGRLERSAPMGMQGPAGAARIVPEAPWEAIDSDLDAKHVHEAPRSAELTPVTRVPIAVGLSDASSRAFPFQPDIGPWSLHLNRIIAAVARGDQGRVVEAGLEDILQALQASPKPVTARYAFALALLGDVLIAGGRAFVRDSRLWVSWPQWDEEEGRTSLRAALLKLRGPGSDSWRSDLSRDDALSVLESGSIKVVPIEHPDSPLADVFRRGLATWSMPYRGREGRMRRMVVMGLLRGVEHPIGLLEAGDDAPHSPIRDRLAGFSVESPSGKGSAFTDWLESTPSPSATCDLVADRLVAIRSLLEPVPGYETTPHCESSTECSPRFDPRVGADQATARRWRSGSA